MSQGIYGDPPSHVPLAAKLRPILRPTAPQTGEVDNGEDYQMHKEQQARKHDNENRELHCIHINIEERDPIAFELGPGSPPNPVWAKERRERLKNRINRWAGQDEGDCEIAGGRHAVGSGKGGCYSPAVREQTTSHDTTIARRSPTRPPNPRPASRPAARPLPADRRARRSTAGRSRRRHRASNGRRCWRPLMQPRGITTHGAIVRWATSHERPGCCDVAWLVAAIASHGQGTARVRADLASGAPRCSWSAHSLGK